MSGLIKQKCLETIANQKAEICCNMCQTVGICSNLCQMLEICSKQPVPNITWSNLCLINGSLYIKTHGETVGKSKKGNTLS